MIIHLDSSLADDVNSCWWCKRAWKLHQAWREKSILFSHEGRPRREGRDSLTEIQRSICVIFYNSPTKNPPNNCENNRWPLLHKKGVNIKTDGWYIEHKQYSFMKNHWDFIYVLDIKCKLQNACSAVVMLKILSRKATWLKA